MSYGSLSLELELEILQDKWVQVFKSGRLFEGLDIEILYDNFEVHDIFDIDKKK